MTSSPIKIYVLFYKNGTVIKNDSIYEPLMAGNSLTNNNIHILGDDSGDHISFKNPYYSELTGIYWIWKNTGQQIVGTCHYRRFFTARKEPMVYKIKRLLYYPARLYKKRYGLIYTGNINYWEKRIINAKEISQLLEKYDAILPQSRLLKYTVETHYKRYHNANDLILLESILRDKCPEYMVSFQNILKGKKLFANNMFVMKDKHYQEFMSWLFSILFEFERRSNLEEYTGYQERILGFIAERLLTIWCDNKSLKIKELQVIYFKNLKYE